MRRTRLYIFTDKWHEVDLYDSFDISLSFSIADVKDIARKSVSHSNTITLPNTPNNARIFGILHEIAVVNASYELLKTYKARVEQDSRTILEGNFELNRVINTGGQYTYEGVVYSSVATLGDLLEGKKLNELDMSAYDLRRADNTLALMAERLRGNADGVGLCLIDKTNRSDLNFYGDDVTPFLWVKDIVNKIMETAGFTYESRFLSGAKSVGNVNFNNLAYPYVRHNSNLEAEIATSSVVSETQSTASVRIVQYQVETSNSADMESSQSGMPFSLTYNLEETGTSSLLAAYQFTAPTSGKYKINLHLPYRVRSAFMYDYMGQYYNRLGANKEVTREDGDNHIFTDFYVRKNGNVIFRDNKALPYDESFYTDSTEFATILEDVAEYEDEIWLDNGDVISFSIKCVLFAGSGTGRSRDAYLTSEYGQLWLSYPEIWLRPEGDGTKVCDIEQPVTWGENTALNATAILNGETTMLGFLTSLFRLFNLYAEDLGGNKLKIEPYPLYWTGVRHDWTDKIDRDTMSFERIGDYVRKVLQFSYNVDAEWNVRTWAENHNLAVGEKRVDGPLNTNANDIETVGTDLSTAVMKRIGNVWMPMIFSLGNEWDIVLDAEFNDRIFDSEITTDIDGNIKLISRYGSADVVAGSYTKVSSDPLKYDRNIYEHFYKDMVEAINSSSSRLLTCNAYLSAKDIAELHLGDTIVIDGINYHINAINEWVNGGTKCEVELIKL